VIKAEFSASLLQSSVSHDPSEIMICCSRNIYKENILFVETIIYYHSKNLVLPRS